jgi:hypothetical protein
MEDSMNLLSLIPGIGPVVEKALALIPDVNERARAEAEFNKAMLDAVMREGSDNRDINKAEATHSNIFVSGWRPFIGWICGIALAFQYLVHHRRHHRQQYQRTHQENLLDLFESAMKSVAVTLIREATFDTTDFGTDKRRGCEGFQLRVKRLNAERTAWTGIFQRGDEHLDVLGHLE